MLRMCEEHVPPELNKVRHLYPQYVWVMCDQSVTIYLFRQNNLTILAFLLIPQMTQKDIAFVADFLSEHFSEVRSR